MMEEPEPQRPWDPLEELTQAALSDPSDVRQDTSHETSAPTFWRLITVVAVAVAALAIVFWRN